MNKEKILKDNERMIWDLTKYFYGIDKNDLFNAGVVGLYKALNNYKHNGNTKFSSYAYPYIYGEMYCLASNKNIKVSKDILRTYKSLEKKRYELAQEIGHIPTNYELAEYTGIDLKAIMVACQSANQILSLDDDSKEHRSYYECIKDDSIDIDTKILIDDSFALLNEDERNIISARYYEDLTQSEIAKRLNMTQVMVSRYEKKGMDKMRKYLTL